MVVALFCWLVGFVDVGVGVRVGRFVVCVLFVVHGVSVGVGVGVGVGVSLGVGVTLVFFLFCLFACLWFVCLFV